MVKFNFSGRPDGLGNRIEQIIMLEGVCSKKNITGNYVWNNSYIHRSYDILFSTKQVSINEKPIGHIPFKWDETPEEQSFFSGFLNQKDVLEAGQTITPNFDIHFDSPEKPVGIHIRGTDRIGSDHHHFMKDYDEFNAYISKTIKLVKELKPKYVYICSENEAYRKIFVKHLDKCTSIVEPVCDADIPSEYRDFFALTLCERIYMCSKFSSFSITASLIGNIPLVSYVNDDLVVKRYQALFNYDLDFSTVKVKTYYKDPATSKKVLLMSYKDKFKAFLYRIYKRLKT